MKNIIVVGIVAFCILVGGAWLSSRPTASADPNIIAQKGIHWHPTLEIYVGGEQLEIPQDIGLVGAHSPIHTHDDLPVIHLEFGGVVTREDIQLQKFFDVWGKDVYEFGENVTMTANGVERSELGAYEMQDGDAIVLMYE